APRTLARIIVNFLRMLKDRQKNVGIIGAPADGTLAAHCRPNGNSALPFKRQALDKIPHSSWPRKAHDRSSSLDILSRAPAPCFARVRTRNQKQLRRRSYSPYL